MDKKFVEKNIIDELGLSGLPEGKKIELLSQMTESVLKRITIAVLEKLSTQDAEEFEKLRESEDPERIDKFLKEKIPNYETMVRDIISDFKNEMEKNVADLSE